MSRLGHLLVCRPPQPVVTLALVGAAVTVPVVDSLPVTLVLAAAAVGYVVLSLRHTGRLCPGCAADLPLAPGAVAERRRRTLRLYHLVTAGGARVAVVAVAPWLVLLGLSLLVDLAPPASVPLTGAAMMPLAVSAQAAVIHRRLRPWCPRCRPGGGGDGDAGPEPDPDPAGTRQPVQSG